MATTSAELDLLRGLLYSDVGPIGIYLPCPDDLGCVALGVHSSDGVQHYCTRATSLAARLRELQAVDPLALVSWTVCRARRFMLFIIL